MEAYVNRLGRWHQVERMVWEFVWGVGASWLPRSVGRRWKLWLLRLFGAKVDGTANVYSSARVYLPRNLVMEAHSCLADRVECYNVDVIRVGEHATVSQEAMLCTGSHDIDDAEHRLVTAPIEIGRCAWVGARAFVGMGVKVGEGAVVGARAAVFKDVEPWTVVGGNPARFIKKRIIKDA